MSATIVLHPAAPASAAPCPDQGPAGCGGCSHSPLVPSRLAASLPRCAQPALIGPATRVQTTLAAVESALRQALHQPDHTPTGLVQRLQIDEDEAHLTLTVSQRCGGGWLADVAFQALRQHLHDTDVYVSCQPA